MIALDAMGGDYAPRAAVLGAIKAAKKGIPVTVFGDQQQIEALLREHEPGWRSLFLCIEHCTQTIGMGQEPSRAVLAQKDSSLVRAISAVSDGSCSAFVSAGNSGAVLVAATLLIGRSDHVLRPAIGGFIPTPTGALFCMDLGANTDCKPEYLMQFAHMAREYLRLEKNIPDAKIGLLSNGHEPYKGCQMVKTTFDLLDNSGLNFVGNVEARDIFTTQADAIVCDGFVGNIMLKTAQATAKAVMTWMKQEAESSVIKKIYLGLGAPIFKALKEKVDYAKFGGALLVGVKKPVVIAHGSSQADAIEQALIFAHQKSNDNFVQKLNHTSAHALSGSYALSHAHKSSVALK